MPSDNIQGEAFNRKFDLDTAYKLLKSGARVIFVGDPRRKVLTPHQGSTEVDFLNWTGLTFVWDPRPGDTVVVSESYYHSHTRGYLKELRKWSYSLASVKSAKWDKKLGKDIGQGIAAEPDVYCENRYGHPLAFSVTPMVKKRYSGEKIGEVLEGSFVFLPRTERTLEEDIQIILSDFCGVDAKLPEPEWLKVYAAPGQSVIDQDIFRLESQIEGLKLQVAAKRGKRELARVPLRLLYDRGISLENAVCDVLAALGAEVRQPDEPGKEDGWFKVVAGKEVLQGVLEVKSTRKDQFGVEGLRQLLEWIQRGVERDRVRYKGVFIGNSGTEKEPSQRRTPFSKDWRTTAELQSLAAIRAEDLYDIYLADTESRLDRELFWRALFKTVGVFDMSSFIRSNIELTRQEVS
jgi:hypothetical protein